MSSFFNRQYFRLIFEDPPDTIEGVCVATTIEGSRSKLFKIRLLSQITTNILLSNKTFRRKVLGELGGNDTFDGEDYEVVEFNVERIRQLREANEEKERKRVRERDKVGKYFRISFSKYFFQALGFIIGMIVPMCILLYITLHISCRYGKNK